MKKCNHLADAIAKIDEAIEQIELLNISVKQQRLDVLSIVETCEELCAQIKIGKEKNFAMQNVHMVDVRSLKPATCEK